MVNECHSGANFDICTWQVKLVRLWFAADMCLMPVLANTAANFLLLSISNDFFQTQTPYEVWKLASEVSLWRHCVVNECRRGIRKNVYSSAELDTAGGCQASLLHSHRISTHALRPTKLITLIMRWRYRRCKRKSEVIRRIRASARAGKISCI